MGLGGESLDGKARPQGPAAWGGDPHPLRPPSRTPPDSSESDWETLDPGVLEEGAPKDPAEAAEHPETFDPEPGIPITVQPQAAGGQGGVTQGLVSGLDRKSVV